MLAVIILFLSTLSYQFLIMAGMPNFSIASTADVNLILSKAPEQSRLTARHFCLFRTAPSMISYTCDIAVSVDKPFVYAC
jgi:hypothetical protein